jgi:hypothetical protein
LALGLKEWRAIQEAIGENVGRRSVGEVWVHLLSAEGHKSFMALQELHGNLLN